MKSRILTNGRSLLTLDSGSRTTVRVQNRTLPGDVEEAAMQLSTRQSSWGFEVCLFSQMDKTYTFLVMLADVAEKNLIENEDEVEGVFLGKRNGREVEEAAAVEIEEEKCRAARGSKRRRGFSDAMSENLQGGVN